MASTRVLAEGTQPKDCEEVDRTYEAVAVMDGCAQSALLRGDAGSVLDTFPDNSIDTVITSPPYWKLREYAESDSQDAIGLEDTFEEYLDKIANAFSKVKRVLKPTGSLWLNLGDKYHNKQLLGMPWRVALGLQDQGWILRNEVIWNQSKGSTSGKDRLRMNRESIFHFVNSPNTITAGEIFSLSRTKGVNQERQSCFRYRRFREKISPADFRVCVPDRRRASGGASSTGRHITGYQRWRIGRFPHDDSRTTARSSWK